MADHTPKAAWSIRRFNHRGEFTNPYPQKLKCECDPKYALWNLSGSDTVAVCSACGHSRNP